MNATEQPQRYRVSVQGLAGAELANATAVEVEAAQARWVTVAVQVPPETALAAGRAPTRSGSTSGRPAVRRW